MSRRPPKQRFEIVPVDEAVVRTGQAERDLVAVDGVQRLVRRFADGRCEEALRLPTELLPGWKPAMVPVPSQNGRANPTKLRSRPVPMLDRVVAALEQADGLVLRKDLAGRLGLDRQDSRLGRTLAGGMASGVLVRERRGQSVAYGLAERNPAKAQRG